ncbi:MAG: urease accessory protein UreD [Hyphomicrobiaceae bacterium]
MSASVCPFETGSSRAARELASIRVDGGFRIAVAHADGRTRVTDLEERGGWRVRFPELADGGDLEAISINTGGGILGGDHVRSAIEVESGHLCVASQAAERIYRSLGPPAIIETSMALGDGARLDWLPQETILFSSARLQRRYDVAMATTAQLLMVETIVLGRTASGEAVRDGSLSDQWRVHRGGKLIFAEATRLAGDMHTHMQGPAIGDGARAMAVVLLVAPMAEHKLETVRAVCNGAELDCGVSAWNGMLTARLMARDAAALRQTVVRVAEAAMGRRLPRVWSL